MSNERPQPIIDGFFGSAVVRCPCGSPTAITVPVIAGAKMGTECLACGMALTVEKIEYDRAEDRLRVRVRGVPVKIQRPSLHDVALISGSKPS